MAQSFTREFEVFYSSYPRHVGKLAALKAYQKARTVATAAEILAGVEQYKRMKPAYADWAHPSTWLNAGRWMDEPDQKPDPVGSWLCPHSPGCHSQIWCREYRDARDQLAREKGE